MNRLNVLAAIIVVLVSGCSKEKEAESFFLKMNELKGGVKTCKFFVASAKENNSNYQADREKALITDLEFDTEGRLIRYGNLFFEFNEDGAFKNGYCSDDPELEVTMEINSLGQMCSLVAAPKEDGYSEMMFNVKYSFNDYGSIIKEETAFSEGAVISTYECDEEGKRVKEFYVVEDYDYKEDHSVEYEYLKFDDKGNWIQRIAKDKVKINDDSKVREEQQLRMIEREIVYF